MTIEGGAQAIPDGPLTLARGLRTRIDAAGHVLVETPLGGIVDSGPDGHAILAVFARPRTMAEAFGSLAASAGPRPQLVPAEATIVQLIAAGAIVAQDEPDGRFGWTDPAEHARMLSDVRRTDAYLAAIRSTVRPDDIVLDIGTGSGILAVAAAQAGAAHVYAIEASDIASVAQQVIEANGVADRVNLIEGWSAHVELPEPATLLVTETIGMEPFEEDILGTILDARERLLAPGARLIPSSLRLDVQALTLPDDHRWASRIDEEDVETWRVRYGIDLAALRAARRRTPLHWPVDSRIVADWVTLGPRAELVRIDLTSHDSASVRAETQLIPGRSGVVDAILVTFSVELAPRQRLVHRPRVGETSSWDASVWFLPDGIRVDPGVKLAISYRFGVPGEADGLSCEVSPS